MTHVVGNDARLIRLLVIRIFLRPIYFSWGANKRANNDSGRSKEKKTKGKENHDSVLTVYGAISVHVIAKLTKKREKQRKREK